ncbi:hypothetical protein [Longitalea luteola]|uniref:hypothetical protein n=1 Tax=Longitalea luteola TaxID=2812563 RepID=UPI001A97C014|nr:hypothetical protein [Longitalea luteola]
MKTSNKILLGIFLAIILFTTLIQVMVFAKYKRGEYVKFNREAFTEMTVVEIPDIRFVSLKGLGSCAVMPGEKFKLEMQKEKTARISYRVVNDTLIVIGDPAYMSDQLEQGTRNRTPVNIYLPTIVPIKGAYCDIRLGGSFDSASAPSYNVQLGKSAYLFTNSRGTNNATVYINELTCSGEQASIDLDNNFTVNNLHMQLMRSNFDDRGATVKKITIEADERSNIRLSGRNIKAVK